MNLTYIISDINKAVYFENTAISLREKGIAINFILINSKNGDLDLFLQKNDFEIKYLECKKITKSISSLITCVKYLRHNKPDVIHCHLSMANWIGLWSSKYLGIKNRIFTRHSGEPLSICWKEKIIDKIQNKLSTDIIAITRNIKILLLNQGVKSTKITLIHHGFELDMFNHVSENEIQRVTSKYNSNNKAPVIGVIARWMEWKGIQYTIESFREILVTQPNAKLCLFGANENGDFSKEISNKLSSLPKSSYETISFEKNVAAIYTLFDVYIHVPVNNSCEAFGQTYVEALASGCSSIFTLSGIANEFVVDRKNALVVPYKNSASITIAIKEILTDSKLKEQLIHNGKESVKQFNFDNYINKLIDIYE